MIQDNFSRRNFIIHLGCSAGSLVAASTILPVLLSACKKNEAKGATAGGQAFVPCPKDEVLSAESQKARAAVKYVEQSPISSRHCGNCKLYKAPVNNSTCGGCMLFAGAVNPAGYCESWYKRM